MAKAPLRDYVAWLLHVAAPPYGQLSAGERHKVHEANIGSLPRQPVGGGLSRGGAPPQDTSSDHDAVFKKTRACGVVIAGSK